VIYSSMAVPFTVDSRRSGEDAGSPPVALTSRDGHVAQRELLDLHANL
jgi:hypothetical protein